MLLLLSFLLMAAGGGASSGAADRCPMMDSCFFKTDAKSCSCRPDCDLYGTCCLGAGGGARPVFQCHGRTRHALFVARACKPDYRGHPDDGATCVDDDEDGADVFSNRPVTNRLTQVTYWNKQCAKCNEEVRDHLDFWDIVVRCPDVKGVDRGFVRRNLAYYNATRRWGVYVWAGFLECTVQYLPPDSLTEVKHCTPDVIQACPPDYPDRERARKCSQSYAERKLKSADVFFRNVHCAICNGVEEGEVECTGMSAGPQYDESDLWDVKEMVFSRGEWLQREPGRKFECSPGYVYDPFRGRCRTFRIDVAFSSAPVAIRASYLLLATFTAALLL